MLKTTTIIASLLLAAPAFGQSQQFYGSDGSYQGQAIYNGNSTQYYGPQGQYEGQSIGAGNSRQYYGAQGGYQGQSIGNGYGGYR